MDLQQKKDFYMSSTGLEDGSNLYAEVSPIQLSEQCRFDNALICSYQQFLHLFSWMQNTGLVQEIGYVILDEAHFFITDARFNSHTEHILQMIITYFLGHTVRVYMSASLSKVYPVIRNLEESILNLLVQQPSNEHKSTPALPITPRMYFYKKKADYSYYKFHFFEKWARLAKEINDAPKEDKWLIFIRDKDFRNEIEKALKPFVSANQISYVDAETKNRPVFQYIVKNKKFEGKVLIATSALDNGVSFHDSNLKHIVVSTFDQESAIQMIGRKRKRQGEKTNVYFRIPSELEIKNAYESVSRQLSLIREFKTNPDHFFQKYWGNLTLSMQKLFFPVSRPDSFYFGSPYFACNPFTSFNNYKFVFNRFSETKLSYDKDLFGDFEHRIEKEVANGFEKKVLSWFFGEKDVFSPSMLLKMDENEVKERIRSYIENLLNEELNKTEVQFHFKAIFEAYGELEGKREKSYSNSFKQDLNTCLKDLSLPFSFTKLKRPRNEERWQFIESPDAI